MSTARPPEGDRQRSPKGGGTPETLPVLAPPGLALFVYEEARLLDAGAFAQWLALFAPDGRYWVPLRGRHQREGEAHNAIADEDHLTLAMKVERLRAARAPSLQPFPECQHLLQAPVLLEADEHQGRWTLYTAFQYTESRGEDCLSLHGHVLHRVVRLEGALRIALKRVNLVNAHASLPMIQLLP